MTESVTSREVHKQVVGVLTVPTPTECLVQKPTLRKTSYNVYGCDVETVACDGPNYVRRCEYYYGS